MRARYLIAALVLAGCATERSPVGFSTDPILAPKVFDVGYERIDEMYLQPVELDALAIAGLNGLNRIDRDLSVDRDGGDVRLRLGGREAARLTAPAQRDGHGWAWLTAEAAERLRTLSPRLAAASADELYQAIFDGITGRLDGFSRYSGSGQASGERAIREGYGGVGLTVAVTDGDVVIEGLLPGGAAERAGLEAGDRLLAIDGLGTSGLTAHDLRDRLRGAVGSTVTLTVSDMAGTARDVVLRRRRVVPNTVEAVADGDVLRLTVDRFNAATTYHLREAIALARHGGKGEPTGYILDLRGNPGGLLDQAVTVADLFIPRGRIISTQGRHPDSIQFYEATTDDITDGRPVVVLVDGGTASSAEIVASALQDTGRAVVIGTTSFGKGSVQTVTRLPNDGELFLTWSRLYAPSGYTLDKLGVLPSFCTSRQTDRDALSTKLDAGQLLPSDSVAAWRQSEPVDDTGWRDRLRATCPPVEVGSDFDLALARRLLHDPALYARAINHLRAAVPNMP